MNDTFCTLTALTGVIHRTHFDLEIRSKVATELQTDIFNSMLTASRIDILINKAAFYAFGSIKIESPSLVLYSILIEQYHLLVASYQLQHSNVVQVHCQKA